MPNSPRRTIEVTVTEAAYRFVLDLIEAELEAPTPHLDDRLNAERILTGFADELTEGWFMR
jgi:hypothetical protein